MRRLLLLFFVIPFLGIAQVPSYYNDVDLSLTGLALKDELAVKVISTHSNFLVYTPEVWDALKLTDLDPNDASKVLLIYGYDDNDGVPKTDRSRGVNQNGGNVGDWNREHVYPKSLGNPNLGTSGPGSDAHHLRPCDTQWNSTRNNRKFADGTGNAAITGAFWYPGDEWKGDVARMMMYMYLRYGTQCLPINVGEGNPVTIDTDMIDLFLQWNADDPVSLLEEQRNPVLEGLQGNRNPFIDNPAFATEIWGGPQAEDKFGSAPPDTEVPSTPTNLQVSNAVVSSLDLNWTASTDNVGVVSYDIYQDGVLIDASATTNYTATGLASSTLYAFTVYALDAAGNISLVSNSASGTTLNSGSGGSSTELFISEYVEGSSYNKAIEIANFTGSSVDLSIYDLRRNTNGGSSWDTALPLSGNVVSGDVFVVSHSSASAAVLAEADIATAASTMTFNGNDPVGLFKNGVLIDVVGTFNNGTSNFAANTTLRRISSINDPSTIYTASDWDSFSSDTFDDIGTHTIDGENQGPTSEIIHEGYFESGLDGWTDGGGDCYRYSGSRSYEGSRSMRLRDNSGTASSMTSETFDLSTFDSVDIEFYFYSYSMENGEDFFVKFYDGSSWLDIGNYARGTDFENNGFYNVSISVDTSTYNLASNSQFRIQCDASANGDHIYVDEIIITGNTNRGNEARSVAAKSRNYIDFISALNTDYEIDETDTVKLYPNPVNSILNIELDNDYVSYSIYNMIGKEILKGNLTNRKLNVNQLNSGVYIIKFSDGENIITERFIKK
ncbi:endonuclease [Winogradskyella sp. PG-2]|uniref:endonuclease n=1 Tax=Winogradskyella sp. PG-2 TaxID=754409 RepID=UPI00045871D9|nr:endonuclease [Winogradskyella sp. PG-2]BAO76987.1 extracellular ribonuclease Bsn \